MAEVAEPVGATGTDGIPDPPTSSGSWAAEVKGLGCGGPGPGLRRSGAWVVEARVLGVEVRVLGCGGRAGTRGGPPPRTLS